ncbi:P27 family phage terminase small subunit [Mesorhizobium sp. DCY119]|uniref:P27 family phage terminase small subunit n=1 Tax=Mesorhizobium sp. DCY119 TaxID=2108445 RepID=UPI000E6C1A3E|nr:P27 family phage terminase small subunit [Mesorhizobium sp. DCY119]RJG44912.1 P27 family phage terminase small subunit [Mesorhizobium sp. DCY119]
MTKGRKAGIIPADAAIDDVPSPPSILDKDARKVWREIMPELVARRILTPADIPGLRTFCMMVGKVEKLERAIQALGDAFDPALYRAQDKAAQSARLIGDQYGLAPTSRSRPSIRDGADDDDSSFLD